MGSPASLTVLEIHNSLQKFGVADYIVFVLMLVASSGVGVYHALRGKKDTDIATEYLMGGRQMRIFPIGMSLIASYISGITLLGYPTEMYIYGTQYMFVIMGIWLTPLVAGKVFLPVFHDMKLSSTYEYLERRFDKNVRLFGSILFSIGMICWLPIVIYVPALAFNQVTGVNVHIITPCVCIVCIFYTTIGGLKAVVWTDVIQIWLMIGAVIAIVIKGTLDIGGIQVVWDRCWESGRIEPPSFQLDFSDRHSVWSLSIGAFVFYLQTFVMSQDMTQRYMALPTLAAANRALWIFIIGITFMVLICGYSGLLIYATFYDCDPLTTKLAKAKDQLLPLLVLKVLGDYPGTLGLFVAATFSAALSSLSTGLNSMAAVVLEDFIKPFVRGKMSDRVTSAIMKSVVIFFGALCVGLVFVVQKLGTVLQLTMSLGAMASGPSFGIFCGGILFPWMNEKGAFYGGLLSLGASGFVILGAQNALATGRLKFQPKPVTVEGCNYIYNVSTVAISQAIDEETYVFPLYKMSYLWYTIFGALITLLFGMLISWLTGLNDLSTIDPLCVSPVLRGRLMIRKKKEEQEQMEMLKKNQHTTEPNHDAN